VSEVPVALFCNGCGSSLRDTTRYLAVDGRVLCIACSAEEPEAFTREELDPE
jgi:hypothetical protein